MDFTLEIPKVVEDLALFCGFGLLGMVLSWAKKWVKDKRKVPFLKFYLCLETRYTVLSIITYFSAIATLIAVGVIDYTTHQSLAMSFMAGYTIDAAVNKDVEPDA